MARKNPEKLKKRVMVTLSGNALLIWEALAKHDRSFLMCRLLEEAYRYGRLELFLPSGFSLPEDESEFHNQDFQEPPETLQETTDFSLETIPETPSKTTKPLTALKGKHENLKEDNDTGDPEWLRKLNEKIEQMIKI